MSTDHDKKLDGENFSRKRKESRHPKPSVSGWFTSVPSEPQTSRELATPVNPTDLDNHLNEILDFLLWGTARMIDSDLQREKTKARAALKAIIARADKQWLVDELIASQEMLFKSMVGWRDDSLSGFMRAHVPASYYQERQLKAEAAQKGEV